MSAKAVCMLVAMMVGTALGCGDSQYCCPDALHCLTPTNVTCGADPNVCKGGAVCCPLTKLCVDVGIACTPTPVCKKDEYCCPDAKHCLSPVDPGHLCKVASDCTDGDVCCPLTNLCVKVGAACVAPRAGCTNTTFCAPESKKCSLPKQVTCKVNGDCSGSEICNPLTKVCVLEQADCTPMCPAGAFCCPDAKACLTPTNPGHLCKAASDCQSGEVCCPLIHECVTVGAACNN